ncbi:hypothetical protein Taro_005242 [Colocasia esculenta]|uniref:NAC domain-containing protein n=1 Tax=Colocasia esculenta TaxID=4460 RepID=A0A843TU37_COLES|nr:hypothetical protein [Colocasia esculenta]
MEGVPVLAMKDGSLELPPGFRFHPTDEEIITHYLLEKAVNKNFSARAIGEVDLNRNEPWELPGKAKMGEKEWYFFCQRDKKYPTGMRTNRATEKGYWKATGKDREIYKGKSCLVGMKKTLVFYMGRAPKGEKSSWVMHEYRLEGGSFYKNLPKSVKDAWVVCRVFHKNAGAKKAISPALHESATADPIFEAKPSFQGDYMAASPSLPSLMESPNYCSSSKAGSSFMDDGGDGGDFKPEPPFSPSTFLQLPSMGSFQDLQSCFLENNFLPFPDYNQQAQVNLQTPPQESVFYPQAAAFPSTSYSLPSAPRSMGYPPHATARVPAAPQESRENAAAPRWHPRNVEQHADRSLIPAPSHDTTLGAVRNAEISSSVLVPNPGGVGGSRSHGVVARPSSSTGQAAYPEAFWKY